MKILILASVAPDFGHFRAAQTVLAILLEALAKYGNEVALAISGESNKLKEAEVERLSISNIKILERSPFILKYSSRGQGNKWKIKKLLSLLPYGQSREFLGFKNPYEAALYIKQFDPDCILLFWDTCFEHLLPQLNNTGIPCFGYLARPPQAASLNVLAEKKFTWRNSFDMLRLKAEQAKHIKRMKLLKYGLNICSVDANWYRAHGVLCDYTSNTWPDLFGSNWKFLRKSAEGRRSGIHILGNLGGLNATGNKIGLEYFAEFVLPALKNKIINHSWVVNICGRFDLPNELKLKLQDNNIALKGFVDDIDDEILGNHIFMLLNNAGKYTGGYTRVMYAFSAGACLVAHSRLADSIPELISGENCLLGNNHEEISNLIIKLMNESETRMRIGSAARDTYESVFLPSKVAKNINDMALRSHLKK